MRIQKPADLARLVKTRRQAGGLTQQDVADAVGITRQSLARIESGHGGTSFETVLRIFERLDIQLEAVRSSQHHGGDTAPAHDEVPRIGSDTLTSTRNVDTSALAAAALRNVDTSALASIAVSHSDTRAIAAAAAAAVRGMDTSALLSSWRNALDNLTVQVQEAGARAGSRIHAKEARKALLSAAIEAGDPDRGDSMVEEESEPRESSEGAVRG
ncbi:helix-turn-helix transcriptional regulator [uncultured Microbacterium sp.]|uniref:helix-turn-helix transcriptional regulator n=1 Tax=uncultured Microbacterium sp. TaxID=191216 RepID=UPI0025DE08F1|nr:helix-turn-helix transcriptional regulator [uncultured Microbacterium sp.]